ncbi:hypothetical protein [Sphingobacterium mizutaii]|uniref:hypothetical protein n=1 Tax=Sphingobacterium mizutaii TaxID=1010 RepID=UPI001625CC8E|nr:hypothetical protein [Sphingobacterium mizutaii]
MENSLTCILIEDDALATEMMEDYIGRRDDLLLMGKAIQRSDIQDILERCSPSIVFLDLIIPYGERNDFSFSQFPSTSYFVIISGIPLSHYEGELPMGEILELNKPISFEEFNRCVDGIMKKLKVANA